MRRKGIYKTGLQFLLVLAMLQANAQVKVNGGFIQDSVRIGDPITYYLTAQYPTHLTILFPDSTFTFSPFEFLKKNYMPTQSHLGISYDSVVYQLATFDVNAVQYLSLPVFVVAEKDCTRYVSQPDSVLLAAMVKTPIPDSISAENLPLLTNTAYQRVAFLLNYPVLLIGVGILLITALVVWIAFGKKIRKYFRLKRLYRNHKTFIRLFSDKLMLLQAQFTTEQTEAALSLWKKYLEQLEGKPFTKLTTRETLMLEKDEQLGTSLQAIDRAIYGSSTTVTEPLAHLQQIAERRFTHLIETLKNG
ncbi:MAG: hypothetical protein KF725_08480 [Cyclobacteriaceae bacterium]|nr:hypothetical protein [Cyclobacteriaceae bacterium]UYN87989.1 MAG: hypothetical protein KIT51_06975 [Cyclobacteriaceae bacterium]